MATSLAPRTGAPLSVLIFAASLAACGADDPATRGLAPTGSSADTGGATGSTSSDPSSAPPLDDNGCTSANLAALGNDQVRALAKGGDAAGMRFLYPYDGTVFPRGLAAPVLMWDGTSAPSEAVYLHIHSKTFRYQGCLKPDAEGRVAIPQAVWEKAAAQSTGKGDPFDVELTAWSGNRAVGPIKHKLIIAPGSLKGSIFYNSYSSALAKKVQAPGGAILRIPAGGTAEVFLGQRACAGCHSASADGGRLVTNEGVYALKPGIAVNPAPLRNTTSELVGLTPDGSLYAFQGRLMETDTGAPLINSNLPTSASQVSFSPDGMWAAFLDGPVSAHGGAAVVPGQLPGLGNIPGLGGLAGSGSAGAGTSTGQGRLALMRFDPLARTLSERKNFSNVSAGAQWPLIAPDDKAIVFTDTTSNDLMILDVASGAVSLLARAMGFATPEDAQAGKSYLPFASQGESRHAFFPTLAPVAVGGYFWLYFDTARRYGNFDTHKIESGLQAPAGIDVQQFIPTLIPGLSGLQMPSKQLWVTAIEIAPDGRYVRDPSAPAFYLPGQEMGANNHRAFSALDPCLDQGTTCDSGIRCCSGFCGGGACVAPPTRCANTEEACKVSGDCCNKSEACIGGFCSLVTPM